ncbi:MAG TPA: HlyD family efflux transporter periplasmic adaptor subunit [Crenalkalicoccus sp.]|jgi:membrane fusion protein|nr:HlyD family efflux transporter periplasmic adaptor subunit [Crenalkalicoccus sp.]
MAKEVAQRPPLFRQEVIAFLEEERQWGRVVPLRAMPGVLHFWMTLCAALAIVVFLAFAQYARKERVPGFLTPAAGTARIVPPQAGTVSAVFVQQGQLVEAGQPLLSVNTGQISADGQDVNTTILATLVLQRDSLSRQIVAEEQRTISERERLTSQIHGLETELQHMQARMTIQTQRVEVLKRLLATALQLGQKGFMSELEQRRREESLLAAQQGYSELAQQMIERQGRLTEARYQLQQLPTTMAEKTQPLRNELSATEQRITEVNGRRAYVIRAPVAGRIATLQASVGQPANPQKMQLMIVPKDSPLTAELYIPARAIGFIHVGQDVRIRYDAFPYQHFGSYRGHIAAVSESMVTGDDLAGGPIKLKEAAYRAVVALDRPDIDAYGKRMPLQPDMLLNADVILDRRSLVDWILNPLLSTRLSG